MESIQKRGFKVSVIATGIIWLVLIILCFALKVNPPHPEYKEIKIKLASPTPVTQQVATKQPEPVKTETKASVKKTEPVEKTEKTAPKKTTTKTLEKKAAVKEIPKKTTQEPQVLQKSVDELIAENNAPKKKQATWDDSLFTDDDFVESNSTNNQVKHSSSSSSFEGTAASSSSKNNSGSVSSTSSSSDDLEKEASSSTTSALSKISSATYTQNSTSGVTSSTSIQSGSKNGRVVIQMSDGSARELLYPEKPVITISKENAALIDSTRKVTILFKVLAGGTVPLSYIEIKPAALLPLEIQNEIKSQVSTWRFASDSFDGQATFDYSIIKE